MNSPKKIKDIHSYDKLRKQLQGADAFRKLCRFLSISEIKNIEINKILDEIPEMQKELESLANMPDEFNTFYSDRGWITHESMNADLMKECVKLAKDGELQNGESKLTSYYSSEEIKWQLMAFKHINAFNIRYQTIEYAYEDTLLGKYYSSVPLLLMVIDGAVNDIDKNKGFFTPSTDLTAWDSIAAHNTGLSKIRDIFNKGRNKTNVESIDLPYRNGILHGRDLNYANQIVVAKCWLTLIALKDWAIAIKQGKKNAPEPEQKKSFMEDLKDLKETLRKYEQVKKKCDNIHSKVEKWKPRNIVIGTDIPANGLPKDFTDFTPEQATVFLLNNWINKNYGHIAKQIYKVENIGKEAKRVREVLSNKLLLSFRILSVEDKAPAISEILVHVSFNYNGKTINKDINIRLICEGLNDSCSMIGEEDANWKFIDNFFYNLEFDALDN